MQKASLGTAETAIASMLGAMHKYARRLIFFGKSSRKKGEKNTEIDWTVFAQSRCAQLCKIGDFSDFASI